MNEMLKVNLKRGGVFLYLVFSVFSLLSSLSLVSCAGSAATAKSSGTSGLCVRVPKTQSTPQNRAAQYAVSDLEVFTVIVESGRFSKSKSCGQDEILEFTDLPVGHYNVTALAKKADGTVTGRADATSVDIEADVIKEVTITIHRLSHYTIQFNNAIAATPTSVEVSAGEKLSKPANPTNPNLNFEFAGWYTGSTDASGSVTYSSSAYNFDTPVTSEFSLYAKWVYKSSTFIGSLSEFSATTFKANTKTSPYTVKLTGLSEADLSTVATLIGGTTNKGVYINLDMSSSGITQMYAAYFLSSGSTANLAKYLTGITLPSGIQNIWGDQFAGCSNLSGTVTIPSTCTHIGENIFGGTNVTSVIDAGSRTWYRHYDPDGGPTGWSGSLSVSILSEQCTLSPYTYIFLLTP